jgi:hypothetical protein
LAGNGDLEQLSDDELQQRLERVGVLTNLARELVRRRDEPSVMALVRRWLHEEGAAGERRRRVSPRSAAPRRRR